MPRLLHDRYVLYDDIHGCDLATGDEVRLDALPKDGPGDNPPALVELLNNGRDGSPRWVAYDVRNRAQAVVVARRVAGAARDRGFVPILVSLYERFRDALAADLDERTLLLIGGAAGSSPRLRAYASHDRGAGSDSWHSRARPTCVGADKLVRSSRPPGQRWLTRPRARPVRTCSLHSARPLRSRAAAPSGKHVRRMVRSPSDSRPALQRRRPKSCVTSRGRRGLPSSSERDVMPPQSVCCAMLPAL